MKKPCKKEGAWLRTMHLLYDTVNKSNGTVVTVPAALSDGVSQDVADLVKGALGK